MTGPFDMDKETVKRSSYLPKNTLGWYHLFEQLCFAGGFVSLYAGGISNSVSHTKIRTNSSYHSLTCTFMDKCPNSTGHLDLDEHDVGFDENIAWFHILGCFVALIVATRYVIKKIEPDQYKITDTILRLAGIVCLLTFLGMVGHFYMRSVHMLDWLTGRDDKYLDYSQSTLDDHVNGYHSVIEGYHVSNETTVLGKTKGSYRSFIAAVVLFSLSQIFSTAGCFMKKVDDSNEEKPNSTQQSDTYSIVTRNLLGPNKNKDNVENSMLVKLEYFFTKKFSNIVNYAIKITILVLSFKVYLQLKDHKAPDFEIVYLQTTHNEFDTSSNRFTVFQKDVYPKHNYTDYASWNETRLDVREHSTDSTLVETHIYAKSNTCQSSDDSMTSIGNMEWTYGALSMVQMLALGVMFLLDILMVCRSANGKPESNSMIDGVIKLLNAVMNMHTTAVLIISFAYYWKFVHNSQSTECQRSGLANSNKIDHVFQEIIWITSFSITLLFDSVQNFNGDSGSNKGNTIIGQSLNGKPL